MQIRRWPCRHLRTSHTYRWDFRNVRRTNVQEFSIRCHRGWLKQQAKVEVTVKPSITCWAGITRTQNRVSADWPSLLHFPPAMERHSCEGSGSPAGMGGIVSLPREPQTKGSFSSRDQGRVGEGRKGRARVKRSPAQSRLGKRFLRIPLLLWERGFVRGTWVRPLPEASGKETCECRWLGFQCKCAGSLASQRGPSPELQLPPRPCCRSCTQVWSREGGFSLSGPPGKAFMIAFIFVIRGPLLFCPRLYWGVLDKYNLNMFKACHGTLWLIDSETTPRSRSQASSHNLHRTSLVACCSVIRENS